jgi:transposase
MGRHEHTVRSWLKAYLKGGIEGLKDTPPAGRTNRQELAALSGLQSVLAKHASEYGYLEAGWITNLWVAYSLCHA